MPTFAGPQRRGKPTLRAFDRQPILVSVRNKYDRLAKVNQRKPSAHCGRDGHPQGRNLKEPFGAAKGNLTFVCGLIGIVGIPDFRMGMRNLLERIARRGSDAVGIFENDDYQHLNMGHLSIVGLSDALIVIPPFASMTKKRPALDPSARFTWH
jgi:hypothetical protein